MIYTVTFNPALDYIMHTHSIVPGSVNRSHSEQLMAGGKGINVSLMLSKLGKESTALGFTAGFTGEALEQELRTKGIKTKFTRLEHGNTRINVKIKAGLETDINGSGPDIDGAAIDEFMRGLECVSDGDIIVLSGSVPHGVPEDIYETILKKLGTREIKAAVDAEGALLINVLKYEPFLVKPNIHELGSLFGVVISGADEAEVYARRLKEMGARNVLVSMAGDGALLIDDRGKKHICSACRGNVKNSVGAGDSMVAGFIAGITDGGVENALRLSVACGSATAFSDGIADRKTVEKLLRQL